MRPRSFGFGLVDALSSRHACGSCERKDAVALNCLPFPRMRLALAVWEVGCAVDKRHLKPGVGLSLGVCHVGNSALLALW